MTTATLVREVVRLKTVLGRRMPVASPLLDRLRADPAAILAQAGMAAAPWQRTLLRSCSARTLILASRQVGKSLTAGALALREALLRPGSLVLLLSPSLRQSAEMFRDKVLRLYGALGRPLAAENESALRLELANGSRIVSLPGTEATIRGFASVALLVIDEAARVPDELYRAVRPMLAVSRGKLVCLSTAYAKQGFFFDEWENGVPEWNRVKIMAAECSRIDRSFLDEERLALGPRIFSREYECEFCSADDAVFDFDSVKAAVVPGGEPALF
jgi:Terminase large subunit, T4likevirus-type, N-terminal